ncbi:hypothetical protein EDM53_04730 [Rickettsiales endosymbiont of Peranema trichophorum]|uniref:hypothetical protein n=1 Tax=Rickettsiales endosymbiont of Peranema trichophorum TaxID=2486577 RepID=UPI0010236865|nr:hypothetical protein [Rickettsiales endosymbiont of Peranema trichophorum]RZI45772.1 hypothetical protein EDM53_04730 [Rickettsiales endosymbiont of Peranema trichophorum]
MDHWGLCCQVPDIGLVGANGSLVDGNTAGVCYEEEGERIGAIRTAVEALWVTNGHAFYKLHLMEEEINLLSALEIQKFSNEVVYLSGLEAIDWATVSFFSDILNVKEGYSYRLLELIRVVTRNIVDVVEGKDAEVVLRTRGNYTGDGCEYWHIDKERNQSVKELGMDDSKLYAHIVFLISLVGERTVYRDVGAVERGIFYLLANETVFYYGHNSTCVSGDGITKLFEGGVNEVAEYGYGSVHISGINGSIHKAPDESRFGRMTLIITPIFDQQ